MYHEREILNIALLHGVNLNMLGQRDPEHYGTLTLNQLEGQVVTEARKLGLVCISYQTNHEGALVEKIQELRLRALGMIINPGAWTHYSYAIRDALEMVKGPVIEVHLSDIASRAEEWRHHSVVSDVCDQTISGKGVDGYMEALQVLAQRLNPAG
ncbi:MAG: 3-dehydroquinate dehydratase [Actinobacteria bacterium]|nr:3-dehydroquinate dehydratase [Actinomycetota bacterium]